MNAAAYALTEHAEVRCQQRGVTRALLRTVLEQADKWVAVGNGVQAGRVSRRRAGKLCGKQIPPQIAERVPKIRVLAKGNTIITVMHDRGKRGRHYRRREK